MMGDLTETVEGVGLSTPQGDAQPTDLGAQNAPSMATIYTCAKQESAWSTKSWKKAKRLIFHWPGENGRNTIGQNQQRVSLDVSPKSRELHCACST